MFVKFNESRFVGSGTFAKGERGEVADDVAARLVKEGAAVATAPAPAPAAAQVRTDPAAKPASVATDPAAHVS